MSYGSTGRANRLTPPSQCQRSCDAHNRMGYANCVHRSCLVFVVSISLGWLARRSRGSRSGFARWATPDSLLRFAAETGGADRDRTDDLKLAKLPLSQLSYGPVVEVELDCALSGFAPGLPSRSSTQLSEGWWARDELNVRPHAYQACALTT